MQPGAWIKEMLAADWMQTVTDTSDDTQYRVALAMARVPPIVPHGKWPEGSSCTLSDAKDLAKIRGLMRYLIGHYLQPPYSVFGEARDETAASITTGLNDIDGDGLATYGRLIEFRVPLAVSTIIDQLYATSGRTLVGEWTDEEVLCLSDPVINQLPATGPLPDIDIITVSRPTRFDWPALALSWANPEIAQRAQALPFYPPWLEIMREWNEDSGVTVKDIDSRRLLTAAWAEVAPGVADEDRPNFELADGRVLVLVGLDGRAAMSYVEAKLADQLDMRLRYAEMPVRRPDGTVSQTLGLSYWKLKGGHPRPCLALLASYVTRVHANGTLAMAGIELAVAGIHIKRWKA
jgi:hypothetical protein